MKIAIVEDNEADSDFLEDLLRQYFLRENIKAEMMTYFSGSDFLAEWPLDLDMVFLDIQMPGLDGLEVANRIHRASEHTIIIFVTNNPQYAIQGYSVEALDYLLKPPTQAAIGRLLPRAIRRLGNAGRGRLTLRNNDGLFVIDLCDVNFIELKRRRLYVHSQNGVITCMGSLHGMEKRLPDTFFRCHSAFIVNLLAVEQLKEQDVIVKGTLIPISKHRRKGFLRALTGCIGDSL